MITVIARGRAMGPTVELTFYKSSITDAIEKAHKSVGSPKTFDHLEVIEKRQPCDTCGSDRVEVRVLRAFVKEEYVCRDCCNDIYPLVDYNALDVVETDPFVCE